MGSNAQILAHITLSRRDGKETAKDRNASEIMITNSNRHPISLLLLDAWLSSLALLLLLLLGFLLFLRLFVLFLGHFLLPLLILLLLFLLLSLNCLLLLSLPRMQQSNRAFISTPNHHHSLELTSLHLFRRDHAFQHLNIHFVEFPGFISAQSIMEIRFVPLEEPIERELGDYEYLSIDILH